MDHNRLSLARRLKLHQFLIFEKVVEMGSILAASRELHMSQPAVSKSMQELESQFGEPLFLRSKRGVRLTEFGRLLERHAQSMLAEVRLLADDINSWSTGISGRVTVGTLISASGKLLPRAIVRMREIAPNVLIQVRVGSNDVLFPELSRGEVDIVVGLLPGGRSLDAADTGHAALTHVMLYDETLCAVVSRAHPLATVARVEPQALQDADWVIPTPESAAMRSAQGFFRSAGLETPKHIVESVSILTNLGLLMESNMVALMPRTIAEQFVRLGVLSILPLNIHHEFGQVGYSFSRDRAPTAATQRLIAALQEVIEPA